MDAPILVERRGPVGLITLNRPAKLNALNAELMEQLEHALLELDADEEIAAIVLTGAGERAFSAGGDMAEQVEAIDGARPARRGNPSAGIRSCKTPTLAAIRGYCYGGAALLAISCDIRNSGEDGRFAAEALRIGLVNHVVPSAEVLEFTIAMAGRIAANSPRAVQTIKATVELALPMEQAQVFESQANRDLAHSPDGVARFRRAAERVVGR